MKNVEFEVLQLSCFDPEKDIVIAYVDVGRMSPARANEYIRAAKERLNPMFEERGFKLLCVGRKEEIRAVEFEVETEIQPKHPSHEETLFDSAKPAISEL
jgi:hypothetical protein